ncbi:MAG: helicase-related protein, partial [Fusobacteriaceae bacterium]
QRDKALEGFRNSKFKVLVATDIAARGLDIPQVTHVINYDLPRTAEAFTHRSGRTGRANKNGKVISFADEEDAKILRDIIKINKIKFENIFGEEIKLQKIKNKK